MSTDHPNEMTDEERDAFLGTGGTGVLSLNTSNDEPPFSVPVSYGYDDSTGTFYFRLAAGSDSRKGDLADRPVTFVAYGSPEDRWQSVVAQGRLEPTTADSVAIESLEGLRRVDLQYVDIFDQPLETVEFEFYRLAPERIGTRRESHTGVYGPS
ncbi:pyridoxamine 5'-phosphate oxidase family protein [Halolamina sp. CBA1230]|uniref:pyridoxamine 5'-phosphate oxidase family protein n=1 Tax=Halolamina sp. CBA1230 TaxID=1853690 RepID=UPI0009A140BE|nr:pyridoxamine 5'-phosphate oxidase family protein [Halolamina sp. CBA1230]QKY18848.1 pyridoxamine 5'-phosphate oxidase family protein [Halolamina sp. CBA1230]